MSTRSSQIAGVLAVIVILSAIDASAECVASGTGDYAAGNINLLPGSGADTGTMSDAVSLWSTGCSGYGTAFPTFTVGGGGGGPNYTVQFLGHNGSGSGDCAAHEGLTIKVWSTTDRQGQPFNCGDLSENLAHELGHVLGLPDASGNAACTDFIMAELQGDGSNRYSRSVQGEECEDADNLWKTPQERNTGGGRGDTCEPY